MSLSQVDRPSVAAVGREALPLPAHAWGVPEALAALERARPLLAVDLPAAVVVSSLTTVVLRCGRHAVKVYPPGTDAAHLERVRRALLGSSAAVVPTRPPVVTGQGVVTVMPWLATSG